MYVWLMHYHYVLLLDLAKQVLDCFDERAESGHFRYLACVLFLESQHYEIYQSGFFSNLPPPLYPNMEKQGILVTLILAMAMCYTHLISRRCNRNIRDTHVPARCVRRCGVGPR